jgi:AAA domain
MSASSYCARCDSEDCWCLSSGAVALNGLPPEARVSVSTADSDVPPKRFEVPGSLVPGVVVKKASEVRPEAVDFAWEDRVPLKSVTVIAGIPGVNKSMSTGDILARITRGQLDGDLKGKPRNVVIASAEDSPHHTLVPRLKAAGADLDRVFFVSMSRDGFEGDIALPDDIEELERAIVQNEVAVALIDPLSAHLGDEVNSHKDQDVRRALGPLARIADRTGCAIIAIVHLNKAPSTDLFTKVSGSIGITAAARSVLVVANDPEAEEQSPKRVIVHGKCNVGPYAPTLRFEVEGRTVTGWDGEEISTAGIVWKGIAEGIGPRDVLGGAPLEREAPKRVAAEDLLGELLSDGPRAVRDIKAAAEEEGISWRTMTTAKDALQIEAFRKGEPGQIGGGSWWWKLPGLRMQAPNTNEIASLIPPGQSADSIKDASSSVLGASLNPQGTFGPGAPCSECSQTITYHYIDGRPLCAACKLRRMAS